MEFIILYHNLALYIFMDKVLVTGGCGFIGFKLTKQLLLKGYEVDVIDDLSIGDEAKDVDLIGANLYIYDINDISQLKNEKYKYVFHLAALSRIQPSFDNPTKTFKTNVEGTNLVCEFAKNIGAKLIYVGSSSKHHNPSLSPYASSKYMGEQWVKMYKNCYGVDFEIARLYNVYGEGELLNSTMSAVIGIWRNAINNNLPIIIHGDGEQRRDFTHIDDVVNGLILLAESNEHHHDAWEFGTGFNYSLNEVAMMFKYDNIVYVNDVKGNYKFTLRVNDDAIIRLGWKPKNRLEEYINTLYK